MIRDRKQSPWRAVLLAGILPLLLFSVIEDRFGTLWGLAAGMLFGCGEILWEWRTRGKVDPLTWGGNGMLLLLGGISWITQDGIWFKLQPSLMEASMAVGLWVSVLMKKNLLLSLAEKQGGRLKPGWSEILLPAFRGLTLRMGVFFAVHAVGAAWAAFYWSTAAWVALKGIGLTVSLIVYLVVESFVLRYRLSTTP